MKEQDQLNEIKQQLTNLSRAVDALQQDLLCSSPKPASASPEIIAALSGYLALSPTLAGDELLETTLRCAMHVVGAGGAGLTLFDQEKQKLVFRAAVGDGSEGIIGYEVPLKGSRHGLAFVTGEVQSATPLHSGAEDVTKESFRNVLVAPLLVNGEGVGTMSAVNKKDGDHFTPSDMAAYLLFADLAALIVRQSLRGQIFEQFILKDEGALPTELQALHLDADDRVLIDSLQRLIPLAGSGSGRLAKLNQLIQIMGQD